ncbi:MAG: hormogonium polysaccharide biosynthesis protein HpsA [Aulosira sp. DedQUE10]|nr:hormogonium polysaccharide biosynthesis protein HpsA [Aulosira sp. DedQUE10]
MTRKRPLVKAIKKVFRIFITQCLSQIKKQFICLLRTVFATRKKRGAVNAGFVLPTVAMVAIVVVLLTTAILFRSFERSKNASNVRVNEIVLRAAAPGLDRAKAKLDRLFQDPRLPRSTPSDFSLSQIIDGHIPEYTFGDETPLKLVKDFNGTTGIQEDEETLKSAWKYPVDTDNNGKFDSFTLYGIYFRTPTSTRPRGALEARAQPMDEAATAGKCASNVATSADLVGSQGWYKVSSKLKRSIFVYTTTVPITDLTGVDNTDNKYEKFTGNRGFSSLEYQQDRERLPLTNNAVIYENDLEITPGAGLYLNGRVFTNGNLLTRMQKYDDGILFYQVSSPYSCYYTQENSKIVVAGNVIDSRVNENSQPSDYKDNGVKIHLFKDERPYTVTTASINNTNKTVPTTVYGSTAAYNDEAYAQRIARLVEATNALYPVTDPPHSSLPDEVKEGIKSARAADATLTPLKAQDQQLRIYFRKRTRRVPYTEVPPNSTSTVALTTNGTNYSTTSPFETGGNSGNSLRPIDEWAFPFQPTDGTTQTNFAGIAIHTQGNADKLQLAATDPNTLKAQSVQEELRIGDRILAGNGLPQYWYTGSAFVSSQTGQDIVGKEWDDNTNTRQRFTQASLLDDLGVTDRDGFWEKAATQEPTGPLDVVGGLRVVTGAGIYLPKDYNASAHTFTNTQEIVWPDTMAMGVDTAAKGLPDNNTPYLQMRATAVYHYQDFAYDPTQPATPQTPIACVASYYDPTNSTTAKNRNEDFAATPNDLTGLTGINSIDTDDDPENKSLNGIVYPVSSLATGNYTAELNYQKDLKYPNGRWVNQPLRDALNNGGNLTLAQQSAVDSARCALKILDGSIGAPTNTKVPHGAIYEKTFLDARQIKAIDKVTGSTNYDLDVELRQPLEIRTTVLDMNLLKQAKTGGEFLFPNSGIIYATRDDALPDLSSTSTPNTATSADLDKSSKDFKLDPTRRPNGIMLINGSNLSRNATYKAEEKGLILVSNLPVYIKGNFNIHTKEEFTQLLNPDPDHLWDNFYTREDLDPNFACRKDQFTTCTTGETWRPATVLADAITILSGDFKEGYRKQGDYALRDNYGNYPVGYDFDGGGIDSGTTVSLNEQKDIQFDLNGDGLITDTTVSNVNETVIKVDMNGDGDIADTSVALNESNITATVAARLNGFWDNNFVTSHDFTDSEYSANTSNPTDSSYFNNFVTPIQRRVEFSEYVMEICPKLTVTACEPSDWVVGYDGDGTAGFSAADKAVKANQLLKAITDAGGTLDKNKLWAGTTEKSAATQEAQEYPRRVAFLRYDTTNLPLANVARHDGTSLSNVPSTPIDNKLVLDNDNTPVPLGIVGSAVKYLPYSNTFTINTVDYDKYDTTDAGADQRPDRPASNNTLWFRTKDDAATISYDHKYPLWITNTLSGDRATEQPLLVPVLQIHYPIAIANFTSPDTGNGNDVRNASTTNWLADATSTETNLVFAQGDTPSRPTEFGGGLENFVRYLERWETSAGNYRNHKASGSFIEFKRSSYATAPWQVITSSSGGSTNFGYTQGYTSTVNKDSNGSNTVGTAPFYTPSSRSWGYDVALLTQLPDLFSQRFTAPTLNPPNEFYREVPRDDTWVKTLLCAAQDDSTGGYQTADSTKYGDDYKYAVSLDQRPSCP